MFITFLSDYGLSDPFVGVCHGVIAQRCPQARVIDLSHGIPPQDIRTGATVLARSLPFLPAGVRLAVVDPGVGGARRGVAIQARAGQLFVGPDNGLLWPAVCAAGGAEAVVDLKGSPCALTPVSATFHGRDVFAPVAAALADGTPLEQIGTPVDPTSLVTLTPLRAQVEPEILRVSVVAVDRFGNLELGAVPADLAAAGLAGSKELAVQTAGGCLRVRCGRTFSDVPRGELLLYGDSGGALSVAVSGGSAAGRLAVAAGDELRIAAA
ncbi:MAG TPA: SAM-dependent chlorinase/fluorinase [Solirubrobacteraceae bacterium]|nr:SAM-dependent chlorinase/fluorinase [Solirubrobacteraceae bacterium]